MWRGIMRCGSLLLLALGLYGQEYAASDDGRIVYFSGRPVTGSIDAGSRLWTWSEGKIRTVIETTADELVRLERLSYDGQTILVSYGRYQFGGPTTRWQVLRHGSPTPIMESPGSSPVGMSRNGNWLTIGSWDANSATGTVTRLAVTSSGVRPAGVFVGRALVGLADDGSLIAACGTSESVCIWDGTSLREVPAFAYAPRAGRYLYFWNNTGTSESQRVQSLQQHDVLQGNTKELPVRCPTVRGPTPSPSFSYFLPNSEVGATDASGQKVMYRCGDRWSVFDTVTERSTTVPSQAVFNSSLTRVLSRPTPTTFTWVPLEGPVTPLADPDSIHLDGPTNPRGILTYAGAPDFTIEWGGQTLPWIPGTYGTAHAPMPGDAVPGSMDTVSISSVTRPWLNFTGRIPVGSTSAGLVPLFAKDLVAVFVHGDYRGFVTPGSPAQRGEYLHFLISGVHAEEIAPDATTVATFLSPRPSGTSAIYYVNLPVVAITPTVYHPYITQITIFIPERALANAGEPPVGGFSLQLRTLDGRAIPFRQFVGYLRY